jgi:hypothetical protein
LYPPCIPCLENCGVQGNHSPAGGV